MLSTIGLALLISGAPESSTLDNGLRVVIEQDTSGPRFALAIAYGAGALDDPEGRAELAHFTEHMTFLRFAEEYALADARATEFNGFTLPEHTVYFVADDVRWLERWLWVEAERMRAFEIPSSEFEREVWVVASELEQRKTTALAVRDAIEARLYPTAGREPSFVDRARALVALTAEDVKWFHRTYYRPDRAVLAIVSPLPVDQVERFVKRYFGRLEVTGPGPVTPPRAVRALCPKGHVTASGPAAQSSVEVAWRTDVEIPFAQALRVARILRARLQAALGGMLPGWQAESSVWVDRRGLRLSLEIAGTGQDVDMVRLLVTALVGPLLEADVSAEELTLANEALSARFGYEQQDRPTRAIALATGLEVDSPLELDVALRVQAALRAASPVVASLQEENDVLALKGSKPCE